MKIIAEAHVIFLKGNRVPTSYSDSKFAKHLYCKNSEKFVTTETRREEKLFIYFWNTMKSY